MILIPFLIITLLIGLIPLVSCNCEQEDLPWGTVNEVTIYPDWSTPLAYDDDDGNPYRRILVTAKVTNEGSDGIVFFHIKVKDSLRLDQDTKSFFLKKGENSQVDWVIYTKVDEKEEQEKGYGEVATVQAVNVRVSDIIE